MIKIYSYGGDIPIERMIQSARNCGFNAERALTISEIQSRVAIGHFQDEQDWQQFISNADTGQVRVKMSTIGCSSTPESTSEEQITFIFHLILRPIEIQEHEWQAIFQGLTNEQVILALLNGGNPNNLRRFFFTQAAQTSFFLLALSILCQGYLAVHSDSSFYKNLEKSVKDLLGDVSQKAEDTEKFGWWTTPFPDESTLTEQITAELQSPKLPSEISNLIDAIYSNQSITVNLVEEAYKFIIAHQ